MYLSKRRLYEPYPPCPFTIPYPTCLRCRRWRHVCTLAVVARGQDATQCPYQLSHSDHVPLSRKPRANSGACRPMSSTTTRLSANVSCALNVSQMSYHSRSQSLNRNKIPTSASCLGIVAPSYVIHYLSSDQETHRRGQLNTLIIT